MERIRNKQGGARKGAGRPKKQSTVVHQFNIDELLSEYVRSRHSIKEINEKLYQVFVDLACV